MNVSEYHLLQTAFHHSPTNLAILDESFRVRLVNRAMGVFLERPLSEIVGASYFELFPDGPGREVLASLLRNKKEYRSTQERYFRAKDGIVAEEDGGTLPLNSPRLFNQRLVPITEIPSERYILVIIQDVTESKEREDELETLLVEMNHRIKNNLASVEALARVELYAESKGKEDAIADIISRISAIGQVHETLYETKSYATVLIDKYLKELLDSLVKGGNNQDCTYILHLDAEHLTVSTKVATKLGLMLAELTTNTLKYALCEGTTDIYVQLHRNGDVIEVRYYDSGDNFDPEITSLADLTAGTGVMILQALVGDLDGTIELEVMTRPPVFVIRFPHR